MPAENPLQREAALLGTLDTVERPVLTAEESARVWRAFSFIVERTVQIYPHLADEKPSVYAGNDFGAFNRLGEAVTIPDGRDERDIKLGSVFGLLDLTSKETKDVIPHPRARRGLF